ncbi:ABC transporter permease [Caldinitratiruptor microaerophilus]|uniref:Spermidine/putrescine ABC transporter permease n=1 Tax=Caldinitratiruptor microaerophilus TaxID=671077 RepID=A0AA35G9T8_9FIRM|nr:ABC transporter permease [Caldinitratiruptor microaerophilus]BDG62421.1 spermidine/putrescine ABC transporter permease [Caldinitratiruptor microaerophilus]
MILRLLRRSPALRTLAAVGPAALWLGVFQLVPLVLVVVVSLASRGAHGGIEWEWGLHNYARFLEPLYLGVLGESLLTGTLVTLISLVVGYPFAYYVAGRPPETRNLLLVLVVIPFWTNMLLRTYGWMVILRSNGVLNTALQALGLTDRPLELLYTRGASILGLVYVLLPFMVLPLYASIEKFDRSLLRAAYDLGARPARAFLQVTLPMTLPGVVAGSILVFVPSTGLFYVSDLMGGAKTVLIGNLIQRQFTQARNWPFGAAAAVVLMAVSLALILLYLRLFGRREGESLL